MSDKPRGTNLADPQHYINRELSWLEFNDRVLAEGGSPLVPPIERAKFLAIFSGNLDEFFMIRVAGLKLQASVGANTQDPSGMSPAGQLREVSRHVHCSVARHAEGVAEVLGILRQNGLDVAAWKDLTPQQFSFVEKHFDSHILPVLTPLAVGELDPFPTLPGRVLNVGVVLRRSDAGDAPPLMAVVPIPQNLPRFIPVPAEETVRLVPVEEIVRAHVGRVFPGMRIVGTSLFRLTRDADISVDDDTAQDLLIVMEEAVQARRRRDVVRLEIGPDADAGLREWLLGLHSLGDDDVYSVQGLFDAAALWELVNWPGFESLRDPLWPPQPPRELLGRASVWEALEDHDVLLFHPYESFDSVVRMLDEAANDPHVLAIKQTLYRTSGQSSIISALIRAAENGKQVMALVELKARFDEARNIAWARWLEDAGCQVIYGIAGYKTHAKMLLIIRQGPRGIRRYVHLSTGNYNDRTARQYVDIGFMTCDPHIAADASAFFNLLTGYSQEVGWSKFSIAPTGMRRRFLDLIERETETSTPGEPGLIMAKMNSLEDPEICLALYRASRAGVRVQLNVRGICCLRPGLPELSENIAVVSILDRFLEHARIFYFHNGGHAEVYLSSADWMRRNLDGRLEVLFPITGAAHKKRLMDILRTCFADNVKAFALMPDGSYVRVKRKGPAMRAQEQFYNDAVESVRHPPVEFHPLTRPAGETRS